MSSSVVRVAVNGASGRMGQRVTALVLDDADFELVAAIEGEQSPALGTDAGRQAGLVECGVPITARCDVPVDVVIDFSTPAGLAAIAEFCRERKVPLVAATTGLTEEQRALLAETARVVPIVFAPSMSLSVNIAMKLAQEAARAMKAISGGVDVEIVERHHRFKEDAPSGTALRFGKIIAGEMGQTSEVHGRSGHPGKRPQSEIGYHALRTGDNVGEHTVIFGILGETLEISVRSHTRDAYALGALAAAKYVVAQPPGIYGMAEVLGL